MKRTLVVVSVLFVFLIIGAAIAPSLIDWNSYKSEIQKQARDRLGFDVDIAGDISFALLPSPKIMLTDVKINRSGAEQEQVVSFERFDLNAALTPLVSGKIVLSSVTFIKPAFNFRETKKGEYSFLTPELAELTKSGSQVEQNQGADSGVSIAIENFNVRGGSFVFTDHTGHKTMASNLDFELKSSDISGPFEVQGRAVYEEKDYKFTSTIGKIDSKLMQTSLKAKIEVQSESVALEYAGSLNWQNGAELQGEVNLTFADLNSVLKTEVQGLKLQQISTRTMVTANQNSIDLKNLEIRSGENSISGALSFQNAPFMLSGHLKSDKPIDLGAITSVAKEYGNLGLDLKFESDAKNVTLSKSTVNIIGVPIDLAASFPMPDASGKRTKVKIDINAPAIDFDKFLGGTTQNASRENNHIQVDNILKSFVLPLDVICSFKVDSIKYDQHSLKDVSAILKFENTAFALEKFKISDFAGASIAGNLDISNLSNNEHINSVFEINTQNTRKFLDALNVDAQSLPSDVTSSSLNIKYSGSKNKGDLDVGITALKGKMNVNGEILSLLEKPELSQLNIEFSHPDMRQIISLAGGIAFNDPNFSKAIHWKSKLKQDGKKYIIDDIDADLSGASLRGSVAIDLGNTKPEINGDLKLGRLSLDVSASPKAKQGSALITKTAPTVSSPRKGKWSTEEFETSILNTVNLDLKIAAERIDYGSWPLIAPKMQVSLQNGVLDISKLAADIFDGSVDMNAKVQSVDQARQPLHIDAVADFSNISLEKLSSTLTGSDFVKISGKVNGNTEFKTSGLSPAALIYDLSGQGKLTGEDFILKGVDIVKFARALSDDSRPGDTVLGLWRGGTSGGNTKFDTLDGQYSISEGLVTIEKMDLDGQESFIKTTGSIDLPNWMISTKHSIALKPSTGATDEMPPFEVSFSGSLDNPTQTFGQGLLNDYLNRKIQRKLNKIISDKIGLQQENDTEKPQEQDGATDNKEGVTPPTPEDVAKEALKEVLGGFLR